MESPIVSNSSNSINSSRSTKVDDESSSLTKADLRCRFYRREFPAVDEVVMTKVKSDGRGGGEMNGEGINNDVFTIH